MSQPSHCLNCGAALESKDHFCSNCGQNSSTHRLTFKHLLHEIFHAFTHADKGILFLLKGMATKPGTVAREYIEGKRKKYFSPFTFFAILMALFVLSNLYFKPAPQTVRLSQQTLSRIPPEKRQQVITLIDRGNKARNIMEKHGNLVAMVAIPFISFFTWLFFRRKFNYIEHFTANLMFIAFANLVFTIIVNPLQMAMGQRSPLVILFAALLLQAIYLSWSLNGFLQLNSSGQRIKSFSVSLLAIALWVAFSMSAMAFYIYQNKDFYQFFVRLFG